MSQKLAHGSVRRKWQFWIWGTCRCTACKPAFPFRAGVLQLIIHLHVSVITLFTIDTVVASLCYKTSASLAGRVVLDGFLTSQSSTTTCECTLTSSISTTVRFAALNNLHPNYAGCGSIIRIESGGTAFIISCYVFGTVQISPSQPATLNFYKPLFTYDSSYCALLSSGKQTKIKLK